MLSEPSRSRAVAVALGGMMALAAAMGIGRFVYTPILPAMTDALFLSKSTAGLIASANFLGYLLGALLAAAPQLSGNRRAWVLGALCVVAATTAGMACGGTTATFVLLRFVGGASSALVLVLGSALVMERLAALGHSDLGAVHFAGVGLGIVISAATIAVMEAIGVGWRSLWLATGAVAALAIPISALLMPNSPYLPAPSNARLGRPFPAGRQA